MSSPACAAEADHEGLGGRRATEPSRARGAHTTATPLASHQATTRLNPLRSQHAVRSVGSLSSQRQAYLGVKLRCMHVHTSHLTRTVFLAAQGRSVTVSPVDRNPALIAAHRLRPSPVGGKAPVASHELREPLALSTGGN